MNTCILETPSFIAARKSSSQLLKAFQIKGYSHRLTIRHARGFHSKPVNSASATISNRADFPISFTNENTPIGTPVPPNFQKIKTLELKELKNNRRVIIVGDVHGCYDEFCSLLDACDFNSDKDNLIMAGDLVNKGPDSLRVLKKAMNLNAFVVRGNHEDNALAAYYTHAKGDPIAEKYEWVKGLKKKQVAFLEGLPFAIRIPSHKLIIVHAGLVPGVEIEEQDMFSMYRMRELRRCEIRQSWIPLERGIEESIPWASQWQGPEHVIFGHDSSRGLQYHPFATGIDTGAVQGDHLSACILPSAKKIPNPEGPAIRENLGMQLVSIDVDGPKKIAFPKTTKEMSRILTHTFTATNNLCRDMYSSFEEAAEASLL